MSIYDWLLITSIQIYHIWCVLFLFPIDTVDEKMIVSFSYACKKRTIIVQVIDWHLLIETFQYISSLHIRLPKIIIPNLLRVVLRIRAKVSLYLMHISKDEKTKRILNPFSWSICNSCYSFIQSCGTSRVHLFEHVHPIEVSWIW